MSRVAIDINSVVQYYVRGWASGIGRTTKELVESIDKTDNLPCDIVLFSQNMKGVSGRKMDVRLNSRHLYLPYRKTLNRALGWLPVKEMLTGCDLYHIPHNFDWINRPDRTIVTIHDTLYFSYPEESLGHDYARLHYPQLAKKCRGIITCSESSKRDIMKYMDIPEEKISVCPWGYDTSRFYPNEMKKTGNPFFLMISCSNGRKNTMSLVKAYEKFVAKGDPSHELVLVWPDPPQDALDYCNQHHLRNHIYITSDVDDERLSRLYNEATATFFPSRYEGFGLPVLESMACGTPVVTCNNSSLPEVGGDAAFYVDPDDTDAMCDYMEKFENASYNMSELRENCIKQASKFSWQSCAQKTLEVYQKYL